MLDLLATPTVVGVPATVLWNAPTAPRPIDAAAVADAPDLVAWAAGLDDDARLGLLDRADTHAVLGEPVIVVAEADGWVEVRLPLQPSSKHPAGYPGFLPTAHLLPLESPRTDPVVVRSGPLLGAILDRRAAGGYLGPDGVVHDLAATAVTALRSPSPSPSPGAVDPADALAVARTFTGMPYLWAGSSAAGVDCSGLVHVSYRALGIVVPRDADDQAAALDPVAPEDARPGDPVFFANEHGIHHVALATGGGATFHAPRTGQLVGAGRFDTVPATETVTAARVR
ncbi:NlpC/P60 family protein [Curtobacterium sp. 9128]|uniref:C40 family peptidase n=1 Tax=Curtobacterium sp. 9128 TaxID=1793722 RepID=UPI002482040A|nr:NlpC/P60 family protein [Curtobacterium sp. 9128]